MYRTKHSISSGTVDYFVKTFTNSMNSNDFVSFKIQTLSGPNIS